MNNNKSLIEYVKKFPGVSLHGNSIRLSFSYQGERCLESLKGLEQTKSNIKYVANFRAKILHEIATKTFDYSKHFPTSNKAKKFGAKSVPTVAEALEVWLALSEAKDRPKTYDNHRSRAKNYIVPVFGNMKLDVITRSQIINWREHDLALANKTKNEILIPFRGIFNAAHADRIIDYNPFDHISNLKKNTKSKADPFTRSEIEAISSIFPENHSENNCFNFACWSGPRISEYLALAWEDVDFDKKRIHINRGVVEGLYSQTKNDGSNRYVEIIDKAWDALMRQKEFFHNTPKTSVQVLQNDNRTFEKEELTFIFFNSRTLEPYKDSTEFAESYFNNVLKSANVRHRGPNQTRHTFASQLLTAGVRERWIANQMGHTSLAMLEQHYAKWMCEEIPDMTARVSQLLNQSATSI